MTKFDDAYHSDTINDYEKDYIGTAVIALSNEPDPWLTGHLIGWIEISQSKQKAPLVRTPVGDRIILGTLVPYTPEVFEMIKDLNSRQAWILFSRIKLLMEKSRRMNLDH